MLHAAEEVGQERMAFMTAMDGMGRGEPAVSQGFCEATREIRKRTSFEWVRVLDHTEKGQAHIHAITVLPCDIATGFDWPGTTDLRAAGDS